MSTQNDLLDGNDSNLERLSNEAPEQSDMCLNWQDDVENNFPNCEPDACGDRHMSTQGEFIEILSFRHFARYMQFSKTDPRGVKKEISTSIHVSVVMELV